MIYLWKTYFSYSSLRSAQVIFRMFLKLWLLCSFLLPSFFLARSFKESFQGQPASQLFWDNINSQMFLLFLTLSLLPLTSLACLILPTDLSPSLYSTGTRAGLFATSFSLWLTWWPRCQLHLFLLPSPQWQRDWYLSDLWPSTCR